MPSKREIHAAKRGTKSGNTKAVGDATPPAPAATRVTSGNTPTDTVVLKNGAPVGTVRGGYRAFQDGTTAREESNPMGYGPEVQYGFNLK